MESRPNGESRTGRPRDPAKDLAIVRAMLAMVADHGYEGASIEKVAASAKVSRAAIYRRWPTKEHLVVHAFGELLREDDAPESGNKGATGLQSIHPMILRVSERLSDPVKVRVISALLAAAPLRPELAAMVGELERSRRSPLQTALIEAERAGEVVLGGDVDIIIDALLGAMYFRALVSQAPLTPTVAESILHAVLGPRLQSQPPVLTP